MDVFIRPLTHYVRRVNLIPDYVNDAARYISLQTGHPVEVTRPWVIAKITKGSRPLTMPRVQYLQRNAVGDREVKESDFYQYLSRATGDGEIIAPTLTTYIPGSRKKSLLATYINGNLKKRSSAKKAMFQAEIAGLHALKDTLNSQQSTFKIKNNALSGAHCSPFTPLWNKTAHSTLTSGCRTTTSYANANNEKFLYGNRHYSTPDIVKTNLLSIITHSNLTAIDEVMKRWGLRVPTVDEVMGCIERGSATYWRNHDQMDIIRDLVSALSPTERSAFMYTSDMYHLAECNPDFVHTFLADLARKAETPLSDPEAIAAAIKGMDDNMSAFVAILCANELKGKGINEAKDRPHDIGIVAATALAKKATIEAYQDFIQTFWVTDNLPSSIFSLPAIVRRGVLTSDTDSTIFTVQSWVKWQHGKVDFSPEAMATANSVVYIAGQTVRHILATMCGNMGVEPDQVMRLKMKNEYYFPVFALTSRAKHYYGYRAAQEGLVKPVMEKEIKGVALRSSATAERIIELAHNTMFGICDAIMRGEKISLLAIVRRVATIEREVLEAVSKGSYDYYKKSRIQDKDAYKSDNSPYLHYTLWNEVFADKYGEAPPPPYQAIKASLITNKPGNFRAWIAGMEDQVFAEKLKDWMARNSKVAIGTIYMPQINLIAHGVPKEIASAVDVRSLLSQLMESFYLILEGLGVYARNKKITRLISDDQSILSLPEGVLKPRSL